jgi:hypothetical protein
MSAALHSPKFKYFNFEIGTEKEIWYGNKIEKKQVIKIVPLVLYL